jgi:hypothetical protein
LSGKVSVEWGDILCRGCRPFHFYGGNSIGDSAGDPSSQWLDCTISKNGLGTEPGLVPRYMAVTTPAHVSIGWQGAFGQEPVRPKREAVVDIPARNAGPPTASDILGVLVGSRHPAPRAPLKSIPNQTGQMTRPTTPAATFCATFMPCSFASCWAFWLLASISATPPAAWPLGFADSRQARGPRSRSPASPTSKVREQAARLK